MTKTTCILCFKTWDDKLRNIYLTENKLEANRSKFLVHNFCRHFGVPLPIPTITWDFQYDHLPFCTSCKETAENFIELQQQLDSIQRAINRMKIDVKNQISQSTLHCDDDDDRDSRVKIIRDLICQPVVYLKRVVVPTHQRLRKRRKFYDDDDIIDISQETPDLSNVKEDIDFDSDDDIPLGILYKLKDDPVETPLSDDDIPLGVRHQLKVNHVGTPPSPTNSDDDYNDFLSDENEPEPVEQVITIIHDDDEINKNRKYPARIRKKVEVLQVNPRQPPPPVKPPPPPESSSESEEEEEESSEEDDDDDDEFVDDPRDKDFAPTPEEIKLFDQQQNQEITLNRGDETRHYYRTIKLPQPRMYSYCGIELKGTKSIGWTCCACTKLKIYRRKQQLSDHIRRRHLNERPNLCELCGKGFFRSYDLVNHLVTHEDKQVICHVCGSTYRSVHTLSKHIQTVHDREEAFPCDHCSDKFSSEGKLEHHINKTHAFGPEIKYSCQHCDLFFTTQKGVDRHIKCVHQVASTNDPEGEVQQPFFCTQPNCNIQYNKLTMLNRHLRRTHKINVPKPKSKSKPPPNRTFPCNLCQKSFKRAAGLKRHQLGVHKIKPLDKVKAGTKGAKKNNEEPQQEPQNGSESEETDDESEEDEDDEQEDLMEQEPLTSGQPHVPFQQQGSTCSVSDFGSVLYSTPTTVSEQEQQVLWNTARYEEVE